MTLRERINFQMWAVIISWLGMIGWGIWITAGSKSTAEAAITANAEAVAANKAAIESMRTWRENFLPQYESDMATVKADVRWLCLQKDPDYQPHHQENGQ